MAYDVHVEERPPQAAAVVRDRVRVDAMPAFMGAAFREVLDRLAEQGLAPAGPPFGRYWQVPDDTGGEFGVAAGFPASGPVTAAGRVEPATLPGGLVATTVHVGAYDGLGAAYAAVGAFLAAQGYVATGAPWESYLDGPEVPQPRTVVCFPCRPA